MKIEYNHVVVSPHEFITILKVALFCTDETSRYIAGSSLESIRDSTGVFHAGDIEIVSALLVRALHSQTEDVVRTACNVVASFKHEFEFAVPYLVAIASTEGKNRFDALYALSWFSNTDSIRLVQVLPVMLVVAESQDDYLRSIAYQSLAEFPDSYEAIRALIRGLSDAKDILKFHAAKGLTSIPELLRSLPDLSRRCKQTLSQVGENENIAADIRQEALLLADKID